MKKSIGILYICTGPYYLFWEDFYNSCEKISYQITKKDIMYLQMLKKYMQKRMKMFTNIN